jgi:hypothetical protein
MDQQLAVGLFNHSWFYFPGVEAPVKSTTSSPRIRITHSELERTFLDKIEPFYTLLTPAEWIQRHGGRSVSHPKNDAEICVGVPAYHSQLKWMGELMEQCVKRDVYMPLVIRKYPDGGFSYGRPEAKTDHHYPTLMIAFCAYVIDSFNLTEIRTYDPAHRMHVVATH